MRSVSSRQQGGQARRSPPAARRALTPLSPFVRLSAPTRGSPQRSTCLKPSQQRSQSRSLEPGFPSAEPNGAWQAGGRPAWAELWISTPEGRVPAATNPRRPPPFLPRPTHRVEQVEGAEAVLGAGEAAAHHRAAAGSLAAGARRRSAPAAGSR